MKKVTRNAKRSRAKRVRSQTEVDDIRPEYDFSGGVRGKYAARFAPNRVVRVVVLAPDVAEAFGSARAVNAALRRVLKEREHASGSGRRTKRTA